METGASDDLSIGEDDEISGAEPAETDFESIVEVALARRGFVGGILTQGGIAMAGGKLAPGASFAASDRFGFAPVAANTLDDVTLPEGYNASVLVRWGDPLFSGETEFNHATRGTAASQEKAFRDNVDGMDFFTSGGWNLIVVNNEYANTSIIWGSRPEGKFANADDVIKGKLAHGITVVEIEESGGLWSVVKDSPFNRRITPDTPIEITGPARGHDLMKTEADPDGILAIGTWNNCGNGKTPWGTYLASEENFDDYFSASDPDEKISSELERYGIAASDEAGYGWAAVDERFDINSASQ